MSPSLVQRSATLAPIPLRIILGIIMVAHGHQKVFEQPKDQLPGALESMGVPAPERVARFVSGLEFFGGLALLAGIFTRPIALLFAGQFLFIVFRMKWTKGLVPGYEYDLALLAGFLSLALMGGGSGSLDELLFEQRQERKAARGWRLTIARRAQ